MQLSDYSAFPANIPAIIEDEMFLYPFMIAPIFLSDDHNIAAANHAIEQNELIIVCTSRPGFEGRRDPESFYQAGVIGSIMRKVALPDGRVKLLFQGLARGIVREVIEEYPLVLDVDSIKTVDVSESKVNAVLSILREKI